MGDIVTELRGNFRDVAVIWELRGNYPKSIDYFEDIDIAELTKGDDDPMYLTIPIGKANVTSGNKRFYSEEWLQELERQVKDQRPIGIMGHLADDELATKFPVEAIHWVGVARVNEMLWGKGYIPPGEARDRVRRYRATKKPLATSIFAKADGIWNAARGAYDMVAETLKLFQIDIGPSDRVGIADLAMIPLLTSEMQHEQEQIMPEKGKLEYISEMTADDARLLPDPVRAAIVATVPPPPEIAQVRELRTALGVDDKADLMQTITELTAARDKHHAAEITARIQELASDAEKGIKVELVRELVVERVSDRKPATVQEAEAAYAEVVGSKTITELLKANVQTLMGPPQRVPVQAQQGQGKYFVIPKKEGA